MSDTFVGRQSLPDLGLWDKLKERRRPISFDLEITARCESDLDCHPIGQAQTRCVSRSRRAPTVA